MTPEARVVIVGGGWAGLAAAVELDRHRTPFILLESARQLGGRARSVHQHNLIVDNGQHLLIGAYSETLRLLREIGLSETDVLRRESLQLCVQENGEQLLLKAPRLPAPWHLVWAILNAKGIHRSDKWQALRMSLLLNLSAFRLNEDISVAELLGKYHQGPRLVRLFWEPLCIATLNTPLEKASAKVFLRVLRDSFSRRRSDSDLLFPKVPLGTLFPESAADYFSRKKHTADSVRLRHKVEGIQLSGRRIGGVMTSHGVIECDSVILAVSPTAAEKLLMPHTQLQSLAEQIKQLGSQPIITAYLQFPETFSLPQKMIGFGGGLAQWLFDRRLCTQPGLIAVVISAEGEHCHWNNDTLLDKLIKEIRQEFPDWPPVERAWVIREKRATFECRVGIESLRPDNATPIEGLWLAGDYTDTGYPATLEGAVRSGVECARRIIQQRQQSN